jgi:hypothetical protein
MLLLESNILTFPGVGQVTEVHVSHGKQVEMVTETLWVVSLLSHLVQIQFGPTAMDLQLLLLHTVLFWGKWT